MVALFNLTGHTQSISVNDTFSEPMPIQFGVPQGSILGPLLFIMYINDLTLAIRACCVELYADDMLIFFFAGKSVSENESRLSSDPDRLISWFQSNFLMLNAPINVMPARVGGVGGGAGHRVGI